MARRLLTALILSLVALRANAALFQVEATGAQAVQIGDLSLLPFSADQLNGPFAIHFLLDTAASGDTVPDDENFGVYVDILQGMHMTVGGHTIQAWPVNAVTVSNDVVYQTSPVTVYRDDWQAFTRSSGMPDAEGATRVDRFGLSLAAFGIEKPPALTSDALVAPFGFDPFVGQIGYFVLKRDTEGVDTVATYLSVQVTGVDISSVPLPGAGSLIASAIGSVALSATRKRPIVQPGNSTKGAARNSGEGA